MVDPTSPLSIAQEFLQRFYGDDRCPRLLRHRGLFFQWDSTWSQITEEAIRAPLYEFLARCVRPEKDGVTSVKPNIRLVKPNIRLVNEVLAALRAITLVGDDIEPPAWLRGDDREHAPQDIVVFRNGILHLPTLQLIPPTPKFFNFNAVDIDWNPKAEEPSRWPSFLQELWPDDPQSIETLRQVFGYCLTSSTCLQKAFMLVGPIRSGKGTIGRVLTALIGKRNVVTPTLSALGSHFGRAPLIGKRLAIIGDAKIGRDTDPILIAEHLLEISGEDGVTIPRKNLPDWIGSIQLKFFVMGTEVPHMTDDSAGIATRFVILRLLRSFLGEEDTGLTDTLLGELPAIAVWAVAGWHAVFGDQGTRRIVQPQSGQGDVDDIRNLASDIKLYLDERCEFGPNFYVIKDDIYKDFCSWVQAQGRRIITKAMFGKKLRTAFPALHDWRPRGDEHGRARYYGGLRLRF